MISFKSFVNAMQQAIVNASDALMDKNVALLDKYFIESSKPETDGDNASSIPSTTLTPKHVILEYPHLASDGTVENLDVSVPLITLVPLSMSKIDKATLSANFKMAMVDGEVQLEFEDDKREGLFSKKPKTAWGKIEISFSPQETSEGFKLLVEGYEEVLKRQIS